MDDLLSVVRAFAVPWPVQRSASNETAGLTILENVELEARLDRLEEDLNPTPSTASVTSSWAAGSRVQFSPMSASLLPFKLPSEAEFEMPCGRCRQPVGSRRQGCFKFLL